MSTTGFQPVHGIRQTGWKPVILIKVKQILFLWAFWVKKNRCGLYDVTVQNKANFASVTFSITIFNFLPLMVLIKLLPALAVRVSSL
jgi:hypothetical protein